MIFLVEGLYLSGVHYESLADGIGIRVTLFVSGCKHNCPGCHSPKTHSFTNGRECTDELIETIKNEIVKRERMTYGITISGGDPFYQPLKVIELIKQLDIKQKNIWMWSGFTFEEICSDPDKKKLLEYADVLVDGPYKEELRDLTLKFRGSKNQRIINVNQSIMTGSVVLWH